VSALWLLLDENSFNEYDLFVEHDARDFDMDKNRFPAMVLLLVRELFTGLRLPFMPRILQLQEASLGLMLPGRSPKNNGPCLLK